MKKKILALILILSVAFNGLLVTNTVAAEINPYKGFNAGDVDSYKATRDPASFSKNGKLASIWPGDWGCYKDMNFGDTAPYAVEIYVAVPEGYSKAVELRIDAPDGQLIASVPTIPGDFAVPVACRAEMAAKVTGVHDVYITNVGGTSNIHDIKFFKEADPSADVAEYEDQDMYSDIENDANRRSINLLEQLGIFREFEDDNFSPEMPITRSEFAYSIFRLYGEEKSEEKVASKFADVDSDKYYSQAVAYLSDRKIINGVDEEYFRPNEFIKSVDAIVILSRILGYEELAVAAGGYPDGYLKVAVSKRLFKASVGRGDILRRTEMAKLIYDAITASGLDITAITSKGEVIYKETQGILYATQQLIRGKGLVDSTALTNLYMAETDAGDGEVVIEGEVYKVGTSIAAGLIGYECEFFYSEHGSDKVICAIMPLPSTEFYEISTRDYEITSITDSEIVYYKNDSNKKNKIDLRNCVVLYNGIAADDSVSSLTGGADNFCGRVKVVENANGKTVVFIDEYVNIVAETVNTNELFVKGENSATPVYFDKDENKVIVKREKEVIELEEVAEGNILSIYESKNKTGKKYIRVYVSSREITGKVTQIDENSLSIDSSVYKISSCCQEIPAVGQSIKARLDINDEITYCELEPSKMLIGFYFASGEDGVGMNKPVSIKMCASDGSLKIYRIARNAVVDGVKAKDSSTLMNGTSLWSGLGSLKKETPVRYSLNSEGEIISLDTILEGEGGSKDTLKKLSTGAGSYLYERNIMYDSASGAGQFYVPSNATLISFSDSDNKEENCVVSTLSRYIRNETPSQGELYSTFGSDYSGDVFVWQNFNDTVKYTSPFVYTGVKYGINKDGEDIRYIKGISGKSEVSYTIKEKNCVSGTMAPLFKSIEVGDVLRVRITDDGEIISAQSLLLFDGAVSRGVVTPELSVNKRTGGTTNRDYRYIYGKIYDKGDNYIAVDTGSSVEVLERSSVSVLSVGKYGASKYSVEYGMNDYSLSVDDVVFVYIEDSSTRQIVIFDENTL